MDQAELKSISTAMKIPPKNMWETQLNWLSMYFLTHIILSKFICLPVVGNPASGYVRILGKSLILYMASPQKYDRVSRTGSS